MRHVKVEEVDSVLTVTLAERAMEQGFLLHIMRAMPGAGSDGFDPELEEYEIATRDRVCEGGISEWSLTNRILALTLSEEAVGQLEIDSEQVFELEEGRVDMNSLRSALELALAPIGFS